MKTIIPTQTDDKAVFGNRFQSKGIIWYRYAYTCTTWVRIKKTLFPAMVMKNNMIFRGGCLLLFPTDHCLRYTTLTHLIYRISLGIIIYDIKILASAAAKIYIILVITRYHFGLSITYIIMKETDPKIARTPMVNTLISVIFVRYLWYIIKFIIFLRFRKTVIAVIDTDASRDAWKGHGRDRKIDNIRNLWNLMNVAENGTSVEKF